jgi:hypothetical protein
MIMTKAKNQLLFRLISLAVIFGAACVATTEPQGLRVACSAAVAALAYMLGMIEMGCFWIDTVKDRLGKK